MKIVLLLLASALAGLAQQENSLFVTQNFFDGSGNQIYICTAPQSLPSPQSPRVNPPPFAQISDGTLTNIVVSGGVGTATVSSGSSWNGGTYPGQRISVSGSATAALNGIYTITSANTSTTTFTFATSAGAATYTDATLVVSTANPLLTTLAWNVIALKYNGSNLNVGIVPVALGYGTACSSRTTY